MYGQRMYRRQQTSFNPQSVVGLFNRRRLGYVWFFVRLYVGWQWLFHSWPKLVGATSIGWIHDGSVNGKLVHHGDKLLAFWQQAAEPPKSGVPQVGYPWYRDFLLYLINHHSQSWFASVIAYSEFLIGLALILGAFTTLAAAGGAVMNFNYMLAGSASLNPVLFAAEVLLILAWRSAGYVGLDRWLVPMLRVPWQPEWIFRRGPEGAPAHGRVPAAPYGGRAASRERHRVVRLRRHGRIAV